MKNEPLNLSIGLFGTDISSTDPWLIGQSSCHYIFPHKKTSLIYLQASGRCFFPNFPKRSATFREKSPAAIFLWLGDLFGVVSSRDPFKGWKGDLQGQWGESLKTPIDWAIYSASWKGSHNPTSLRGLNEPWLLTTYQMGSCTVLQDIFLCVNAKPRSRRNTWIWVWKKTKTMVGGVLTNLLPLQVLCEFFCLSEKWLRSWASLSFLACTQCFLTWCIRILANGIEICLQHVKLTRIMMFFSIVLSENRIQTFKGLITLTISHVHKSPVCAVFSAPTKNWRHFQWRYIQGLLGYLHTYICIYIPKFSPNKKKVANIHVAYHISNSSPIFTHKALHLRGSRTKQFLDLSGEPEDLGILEQNDEAEGFTENQRFWCFFWGGKQTKNENVGQWQVPSTFTS